MWVDFYLFRNVKSTDTLEKDETSKQIQANQIWERKLEAEKNNNFVLAAKHEKEFRVSQFIQSIVALIVLNSKQAIPTSVLSNTSGFALGLYRLCPKG